MEHRTNIVVRYSETDQMRVVYYAHYFVWMEQARTGFLESIGMPYHKLEEQGYYLPVLEAHAQYLHPTRYGDQIVVSSRFSLQGPKIRVDYEIKSPDRLLAQGHTVHVFTNANGRPVRPPKELVRVMAG